MRGLDRARRVLGRFAGPTAPKAPPDGYEDPTVRLLFDAAYYRRQGGAAIGDPLADYLRDGWRRRLDPHPLFSTAYYLEENTDVADAGLCPLVHYARHGAGEDRRSHPLFDPRYYRDRYVDVSDRSIDPLVHFVVHGELDGRDPNPWFDSAFYRATNPDVAAAGVNPLVHYAVSGWRAGRNPHGDFDVAFYTASNPELDGREPLAHFLTVGLRVGREPCPDYALRPLRRPARYVAAASRRLVVLTEDGHRLAPGDLLARCPTIVVTSAARYQPEPDDDVYAPDRPTAGLPAEHLISVAVCLAHQAYDFVVVTHDHATASVISSTSPANAVVVSADGYRRRRAGRPLRAGSIGREVRLPVPAPTGLAPIAVDDLGLGPLIRFGHELVVAGDSIVAPPIVARRRPPGPLISNVGDGPSLEVAELGPPDLHEAMRLAVSG